MNRITERFAFAILGLLWVQGCGTSDSGPLTTSQCGNGESDASGDSFGGSGGEAGSGGSFAGQAGAGGEEAGADAADAPEAEVEAAAETSTEAAPTDPFGWYTCPFVTGMLAQCGKIKIPLDWSDPNGKQITLYVKRSLAEQQPARGQVWLLQGGPGVSGTSIEGFGKQFRAMAPDLDIYIPDHRGVGLSEKLPCPDTDPMPGTSAPLDPAVVGPVAAACIKTLQTKYGSGLGHFSAVAAGRDLGEMIARLLQPNQQAFVVGWSYGTLWAHRYLQQFPNQAAGVVLDAFASETHNFFNFDKNIDAGAKRILDDCSADAFCKTKLGDDAWGKAKTIMAKLDTAGYCATTKNLKKDDYRAMLAVVAQGSFWTRLELAPLLYRLDRCDATDAIVLGKVHAVLALNAENGVKYHSGALHFNIVNSESEPEIPPSDAELAALDATLTISSVQMRGYRAAREGWPLYDPSPYEGNYAQTTTPLLMLSGTYDIQTPNAEAQNFASHFTSPHQTYVPVKGVPHCAFNGSPMLGGKEDCGVKMVTQFLNDPAATIDTSCANQIEPFDFEKKGYSYGEGTVDVWENSPNGVPHPGQLQKKNAIDELREELRRLGGLL